MKVLRCATLILLLFSSTCFGMITRKRDGYSFCGDLSIGGNFHVSQGMKVGSIGSVENTINDIRDGLRKNNDSIMGSSNKRVELEETLNFQGDSLKELNESLVLRDRDLTEQEKKIDALEENVGNQNAILNSRAEVIEDGEGLETWVRSKNTFSYFQNFTTYEGYGLETFTIDGVLYLFLANKREGNLYNTNSVIYKWEGNEFHVYQYIPTHGARRLLPFSLEGNLYLAVANHYDDVTTYLTDSVIYKWEADRFEEFQRIPTKSAYCVEHVEVDGEVFLAFAYFYDLTTTSYSTNSVIYRWNGTFFDSYQEIWTTGAMWWESFKMENLTYLAVANFKDGSNFVHTSVIYLWNGTYFESFQEIETTAGHNWEFFTIGKDSFLALAQEFDGVVHDYESKIFKWDGSSFQLYQTIPTVGGVLAKAFSVHEEKYLAIAGYYNGRTHCFNSVIHRWNGAEFVVFQRIQTCGCANFESFEIDGTTFLAAINAKNDVTGTVESVVYFNNF